MHLSLVHWSFYLFTYLPCLSNPDTCICIHST